MESDLFFYFSLWGGLAVLPLYLSENVYLESLFRALWLVILTSKLTSKAIFLVGFMSREMRHQRFFFLPGSSVYSGWHWLRGLISRGWAPNMEGCYLTYPACFPTTSKFLSPPYKVYYKFCADNYRCTCTNGYRLCHITKEVSMSTDAGSAAPCLPFYL